MTQLEKFDVIFTQYGPRIEYHYCREWDDEACYGGGNPDHGLTFEEAKDEMIGWHLNEIERLKETKKFEDV